MTKATDDPRIARLLIALRSGQAEPLRELCHPDLVIEDPPSLPYGGTYSGFAGLCHIAERMYATWSDLEVTTESVIGDASGDDFVLVQRMRARSAQTGRPVEMSILELYSFRDGLLIGIRPHYWDTKALVDLQQNG